MTQRWNRDILAGISTFLTILYLFILYPQLLAMGGVDQGSAFTATIVVTVVSTLFLGFYANFPVALGPGLGAGAFLVYSLVLNQEISWNTALGLVFWCAFAMFLISLFKLRQKLIYNLPPALRIGTLSGIGLFLISIGLKELNIIARDPDTFWKFEGIGSPTHIVVFLALVLLIILYQRRVAICYIIAILFGCALGLGWNLFEIQEIAAMAPPALTTDIIQADLASALQIPCSLLALFLINIFDTSASITTLASMAELSDEKGHIRNLNKVVLTDGSGSMLAAILGVGTLSFLVESTVGIKVGGRTGRVAIVVAILSLCALFFYPLIASIPFFVTAPVLLVIGGAMVMEIKKLTWNNFTDLVPALLTFITIPLTFSIYAGFALGFVSFTILKALRGQAKQVHPICWIITLFFLYNFFHC